MTYYNYKWHILRCGCGSTLGSYEVHTVRQSQIINGRFAPCIGCGRILDLTKDNALPGINSILVSKITVNGSYILPSGIIVLVDEDYDDYINGELIFYDKEKEKE